MMLRYVSYSENKDVFISLPVLSGGPAPEKIIRFWPIHLSKGRIFFLSVEI